MSLNYLEDSDGEGENLGKSFLFGEFRCTWAPGSAKIVSKFPNAVWEDTAILPVVAFSSETL